MFYHGSLNPNITELTTNHSKDGYVYVTSSRLVALTYVARSFPNLFFSKNEKEVFWELKEGLFETMVKGKSGYIYTLEDKLYENIPQNNYCGHQHCLRVKENVKVSDREFVEDVYSELLIYAQKGEFEIIRFETIPEEIREREANRIRDIVLTLTEEERKNYHWNLFL